MYLELSHDAAKLRSKINREMEFNFISLSLYDGHVIHLW